MANETLLAKLTTTTKTDIVSAINEVNTKASTTYTLPTATASVLGGIKVGSNITVSSGTISVATATASALGVVKIGSNITVASGVISVPAVSTTVAGVMSAADKTKLDGIAASANNYVLPTATASVLGGVKNGTNIVNTSGVLSVANGTTSAKGVVQLTDSIASTSTTTAATPNSVKKAYDLANSAFQSASEGKTKIASALTSAGINAGSTEDFSSLATKISSISVDKTYEYFKVAGELKTEAKAGQKVYGINNSEPFEKSNIEDPFPEGYQNIEEEGMTPNGKYSLNKYGDLYEVSNGVYSLKGAVDISTLYSCDAYCVTDNLEVVTSPSGDYSKTLSSYKINQDLSVTSLGTSDISAYGTCRKISTYKEKYVMAYYYRSGGTQFIVYEITSEGLKKQAIKVDVAPYTGGSYSIAALSNNLIVLKGEGYCCYRIDDNFNFTKTSPPSELYLNYDVSSADISLDQTHVVLGAGKEIVVITREGVDSEFTTYAKITLDTPYSSVNGIYIHSNKWSFLATYGSTSNWIGNGYFIYSSDYISFKDSLVLIRGTSGMMKSASKNTVIIYPLNGYKYHTVKEASSMFLYGINGYTVPTTYNNIGIADSGGSIGDKIESKVIFTK